MYGVWVVMVLGFKVVGVGSWEFGIEGVWVSLVWGLEFEVISV